MLIGIKSVHNANDAIQNALVELMEKKPLSEITVKEICKNAGVNRQSFYYYYSGIKELAWNLMEQGVKMTIVGCNPYRDREQVFTLILDFMCQNRKIMMNVYESKFKDGFIADIVDFSRHQIEITVHQCREDIGVFVKDEDEKFLVDCYSFIIVGLLIQFLDHGMKDDPEQLKRQYDVLMHDSIQRNLREFNRSYEQHINIP